MNLIYIGDKFYRESQTMMASLYTENGKRYDWGFVGRALENGEEIHIRQANKTEIDYYNKKLKELREKRVSNDE